MKRVLAITLCFIFIGIGSAFAQNENIKGVQFKDGSIVYGRVIKVSPTEIQIEMKDGNIMFRKFEDVETLIKDGDVVSEGGYKSTSKLKNYFALKGGIYTPTSDDLQGFGNGFNGEVVLGHYLNPYLATELGIGYFKTSVSESGSLSSGTLTATGSMNVDLWVVPITLAIKAIYPVNRFEFYGLGGIGAYFTHAKVAYSGSISQGSTTLSGSGTINSDATAFGGFLGGGANLNFDQNWYIGVEGKYLWAKPSFNIMDTHLNVNMEGWVVTGNVGFKF